MFTFLIVSLILTTIFGPITAIPYSADSDYLEAAALSFGDDAALDYQLFDSQQFDDQDGLADALNSNGAETDTLFSQDVSDLDGSYLQAYLDEPGSTINTKNSEDSISSAAMCDASIDGESLKSSNPLRAKDLSDIFNLRLPDLGKKPSCRNPRTQPPQSPTLQPEWAPNPVIDPVNVALCPRESDGIQPIALCCYEEDFGKLGERIAVSRECYTCRFGTHSR